MTNINENEQSAFEEFLGDACLDDSIDDAHQARLRSQVMQVFDEAHGDATRVVSHVPSFENKSKSDPRRTQTIAVVVAACAIAFVAVGLLGWSVSVNTSVTDRDAVASVEADPQLLASLSGLDAFRDEMSSDEYFDAIALCQQDYEARVMLDTMQP